MNESHMLGLVAIVVQFAVAGYALKLNRSFGTTRVGWSLFGAFALLALLQCIQSTAYSEVNNAATLRVNATYVLISFMLLIGMLHLGTMLRERARTEQVELKLRAALETEVKAKTAHLNRAIVELVREVDESKRMAAIIKSGENNNSSSGGSMALSFPSEFEGDSEHFLANILGGEWIAHF
jgi:hypothetical protein